MQHPSLALLLLEFGCHSVKNREVAHYIFLSCNVNVPRIAFKFTIQELLILAHYRAVQKKLSPSI